LDVEDGLALAFEFALVALAFARDAPEPFDFLEPFDFEPDDRELELDRRALDFVFVCATVTFLSSPQQPERLLPPENARLPVVGRDNQSKRGLPDRRG
jgi:hypothetical protein